MQAGQGKAARGGLREERTAGPDVARRLPELRPSAGLVVDVRRSRAGEFGGPSPVEAPCLFRLSPGAIRGPAPLTRRVTARSFGGMEARDTELKKELDATLHARRDLGEEYDSALVESFLEKIEERLDAAVERRVRRLAAEQQITVARSPRRQRSGDNFGERFGFAIVTMVLAIPLSAIGVANADLAGLIVTWLGIVGVNAAHAAQAWPWQRRRSRSTGSDWND